MDFSRNGEPFGAPKASTANHSSSGTWVFWETPMCQNQGLLLVGPIQRRWVCQMGVCMFKVTLSSPKVRKRSQREADHLAATFPNWACWILIFPYRLPSAFSWVVLPFLLLSHFCLLLIYFLPAFWLVGPHSWLFGRVLAFHWPTQHYPDCRDSQQVPAFFLCLVFLVLVCLV